jgi:hypothetical protein
MVRIPVDDYVFSSGKLIRVKEAVILTQSESLYWLGVACSTVVLAQNTEILSKAQNDAS